MQLADASGTVLMSCTAERAFDCLILSHPSIVQGGSYTLTIGSSVTEITMTGTVYSGSGTGAAMPGNTGGGMADRGKGKTGGDPGGMGGTPGGKGRNP